ncbi:MAG: hypothetical protein V4567_05350 [Pseudomonadota bacterium]
MIALRAQKVPEPDPHQELMRAMAASEGRLLLELSDQREAEQARQALFEAQLRKEIQGLVIREMKSSMPPPPHGSPTASPGPLSSHAKKSGFEWTHLQYVAAVIVALTGLIALILNAQKPNAEVLKRFDDQAAAQQKTDKKIDAHITAESDERTSDRLKDYEYQLSVRSWITDVLEKAASVKIDDPPGTPKRDQLQFYPPPLISPHKITGTHIVQPRDPYPVPPPP